MADDVPVLRIPDGWEGSARIVEAFASTVGGETAALLAEIAGAIRDRAVDD